MGKEETTNKNKVKIIALLAVIIVIALFLQAGILYNINSKNAYKTSKVLLNQVVDIIEKNQKNEQDMIKSLKEDYIVRAKAVSYIIDAKPEAEKDTKELQKIADLMLIDEIHLFDKTGKIYSGTIPKYYGYNFNSGKQMAYFKPMLKNKKLTMCQDVTPNTSEGKKVMYAITWNETGSRMIQVGIRPVRLLEEVKQNEVKTVISNMPVYEGINIFVANQENGKIYGATDKSKIGKTLDEISIDGEKYNSIRKKTGNYIVEVKFTTSSNNINTLITLLIVAVYLSIAAGCILVMVHRLSKVKREKKEQSKILRSISEISNKDELTDCFNRRAYEEDIANLSMDNEFIYASVDVNGLKVINDSLGHAAGDELLCGAATCMKQCFHPYGKVYRVGGDEFIIILPIDLAQFEAIKEQFDEIIKGWSGEQIKAISVSCGYVSSKESMWSSIKEIAHVADIRMYEEKARYYKNSGVDRRGLLITHEKTKS